MWADVSKVGEQHAQEQKPSEEAGSLFFETAKCYSLIVGESQPRSPLPDSGSEKNSLRQARRAAWSQDCARVQTAERSGSLLAATGGHYPAALSLCYGKKAHSTTGEELADNYVGRRGAKMRWADYTNHH